MGNKLNKRIKKYRFDRKKLVSEQEESEASGGEEKEKEKEKVVKKKSRSERERERRKARLSTRKKRTLPSIERPAREKKTVERYSIEKPSTPKALSIEKGRGTQLKDIPNVAFKLSKRKPDENLQMLHAILFGKKAKVQTLKRNINQFSGFVWVENEEKQRVKIKEKLDKCVKEKLSDFCDILDIPISRMRTKKEILDKLVEFLESPHATTEVSLAEKQQLQKSKKKKRKSSASAETAARGASAVKTKKRKRSSEVKKKQEDSDEDEDEDEDEDVYEAESADTKGDSDEVGDDVLMEKEMSDQGDSESEKEDEGMEQESKEELSFLALQRIGLYLLDFRVTCEEGKRK